MIIQNCLIEVVGEYNNRGYITYVFKYLDEDDVKRYHDKVLICTRYPNWDCKDLKRGDVGYVEIEIVRAGIDTWFDGKKQIPYKNNAKRFIKFIDKPKEEGKEDYTL